MDRNQNFLAFGKIAWLWSNSVLHKDWSVNQQAGFVLPAIANGQYYIVEEKGYPVAYCSWALLDRKTEEEYLINPNALDPDKWNSGDRLWFIDWISPFSAKYTWALRSELNKRFPDKIARAMRVKKGDSEARIASFTGGGLSKADSRSQKRRYFEEMVEGLSSNSGRGKDFFLGVLDTAI
ncbi:toxin-activating lysine-acyltransferase [Phaeobacter inhibens]|uniref:toxin-activating lysine-acyltransferase n=1 Tax=Phaeobacter inhibens TaxID=221822 RepID=UPI0021A57CC0|nr:toxin-activating lysine-acyltransferase [Phaeobacter inhibens]UWR59714.1 toxin-activating lysine-acyltransferase [Phaeobacter inhibens]